MWWDAGSDEWEVQEREAPGDGEQRAFARVGDLLRRAGAGEDAGAAAADGRGRREQPLQGVHVAGVQGLGLQDQARGEQALPLRDHQLGTPLLNFTFFPSFLAIPKYSVCVFFSSSFFLLVCSRDRWYIDVE